MAVLGHLKALPVSSCGISKRSCPCEGTRAARVGEGCCCCPCERRCHLAKRQTGAVQFCAPGGPECFCNHTEAKVQLKNASASRWAQSGGGRRDTQPAGPCGSLRRGPVRPAPARPRCRRWPPGGSTAKAPGSAAVPGLRLGRFGERGSLQAGRAGCGVHCLTGPVSGASPREDFVYLSNTLASFLFNCF